MRKANMKKGIIVGLIILLFWMVILGASHL